MWVWILPAAANPLTTSPMWTLSGGAESGDLGGWPLAAADLDQDGFTDLIIPSRRDDDLREELWVFPGAAEGPTEAPAQILTAPETPQWWAGFGVSVAPGDYNGDGLPDLLVGCPDYSSYTTEAGYTFLYLGGASGPDSEPDWSVTSTAGHAWFGWTVLAPGDLDGDGLDELGIASSASDVDYTWDRRLFVHLGNGSLPDPEPTWTLTWDDERSQSDVAADAAGDVDGDGYPDLLVGDSDWQNDGDGVLLVFAGGVAGPDTTPRWMVTSPYGRDGLGCNVTGAGDVNGDGFADVLGGAAYYDAADGRDGSVLLYLGGPDGPEPSPAWRIEAEEDLDKLGYALDGVGDVDGDGLDDVLLGAFGGRGAAVLFLGAPEGLAPTADWSSEGEGVDSRYGYKLASAGDVNGDGALDVSVGAPNEEITEADDGAIRLYFGCTGTDWPDADGDGWTACEECDDTDPARYPGAPEACTDTGDLDCDGVVSFVDEDEDGHPACLDCDDQDPDRFPGHREACDGVDQDCDGVVDESACGTPAMQVTATAQTGVPDHGTPHGSAPPAPCGCSSTASLAPLAALLAVAFRRQRPEATPRGPRIPPSLSSDGMSRASSSSP